MSSLIFQPLLHDPLGWKSSNSTYTDTFTWKHYRPSNKNARISMYGQRYQRQLKKQQQQQQQQQQQTNVCLPLAANEEQTVRRIILGKKNENSRVSTPVSHRSSPSKSPPPVVTEESLISLTDSKQRSASINRETPYGSRASQHPSIAVEETCRPATADARRSPKEEKIIIDPNNDNSRHWLTFPNTKTPQYIIDIKQRLGQLKIRPALTRPISASNATAVRPESSASHRQQQPPSEDQRHLFDFNLPQTPNELRAARHRLEKHRYNPALDNYPPRPQTCPIRTNETPKPVTPPNVPESDDEQLPPTTKDDVSINEDENKIIENETLSSTMQTFDMDGLPNEYVEDVETANIAQEEYWKYIKTNPEKKSDSFVYRLPSLPPDDSNQSMIAYRNQQQSTTAPPPTNTNSTHLNEFDSWVRQATDKERESAMKILRDVLHPQIMGYEIPIKQQPIRRPHSTTRKLGRTRTPHQRIPCEICEKEMIKRHVWSLNQSDTLICPHQPQGIKPALIEIGTS